MNDRTNASGAHGEEPEDSETPVAGRTGQEANGEKREEPQQPENTEEKPTAAGTGGPETGGAETGDAENSGAETDGGQTDGPQNDRAQTDGPENDRPQTDGPQNDRPQTDGPENTGPQNDRPQTDTRADEPERPARERERGTRGSDGSACGPQNRDCAGGPESCDDDSPSGAGGPVGPEGRRPGSDAGGAPAGPPRIPLPRSSVEDTGLPLPDPAPRQPPPPASPQERPRPPHDDPGASSEPSVPPHAPTDSPDPCQEPAASPAVTGEAAAGEPSAVPQPPAPSPLVLEHRVLKALLGAWALAVCSGEETAAVEEHLGVCGGCADEARRLREAVGLLHPPESLDLDPSLRTRVLRSCLDRRAPRIPVPAWAAPYDAEAARLDALLQDIDEADWHAPVRLRWFEGQGPVARGTTVAGVIAHLLTVDGLVATALGLEDPLEHLASASDSRTPEARTEACWKASHFPPGHEIRGPWREQSHAIVRTTSFRGGGPQGAEDAGGSDGSDDSVGSERLVVSYGGFALPLRDAMLDRAFECWIHAEDIAEAVDYPYAAPSGRHLHGMIDLAARMLPLVLAERRRAGLASRSPAAGRRLVAAGAPGRSLRLEIEGSGGGEWLIPLDSPAAVGSAEHQVAHVALDGVEFCRLAAGHVPPEEAAAGQVGDRDAIRDILFAAASLSRM